MLKYNPYTQQTLYKWKKYFRVNLIIFGYMNLLVFYLTNITVDNVVDF